MLQSNRYKFSRTIVSPTCRICGLESEDITHNYAIKLFIIDRYQKAVLLKCEAESH